jgi:hypothetical protein
MTQTHIRRFRQPGIRPIAGSFVDLATNRPEIGHFTHPEAK